MICNIQHIVNFQVTLDELKTDNAGCKFDAIIAEIDSKKLETQQNYTNCYEEENKSTLQVENELHLATVRFVSFYRKSAYHCAFNSLL